MAEFQIGFHIKIWSRYTTTVFGLIINLTAFFFSNSCLSVQKMKQLKINVSEAKLKVLQHLALIEIDKKGSVCLFNCNWKLQEHFDIK